MAKYTWILGTIHNQVRWYKFTYEDGVGIVVSESEYLEIDAVTAFESKEAARDIAVKAGLKTWRYFRF